MRLLIVGCGNMGGAMLAGWLASGRDPGGFTLVDPLLASAPDGVTLTRDGLMRVDSLLPRFFLPQHTNIRDT